MKTVIVLAIALAAVRAFHFHNIINGEWEAFKRNYNKVYPSRDAELVRKLIFADHLYKIGSHNERYVKGLESYTIGINQFTDTLEIEIPKGLTVPGQNPDAVLKYLHVGATS